MEMEFSGEIWFWKGPSPFHFVTVPEELCDALDATAGLVSYGWGMIPVQVRIGDTGWKTSLWPKDGRYIVPLKDAGPRGSSSARPRRSGWSSTSDGAGAGGTPPADPPLPQAPSAVDVDAVVEAVVVEVVVEERDSADTDGSGARTNQTQSRGTDVVSLSRTS